MKQNYIKNKLYKQNDTYRKLRIRTPIQLGGLIDKAAELLGFLVEATHNNFNEPTDFTKWNKIDKRYLSQ
ncbi:MAG: conjugal transfer protein TraD [Rickettsiales endosymbiont of Dermacentor nuttalli]